MTIEPDVYDTDEIIQTHKPIETRSENTSSILLAAGLITIAETLLYLEQPYYGILVHVLTIIGLAISTSSLKNPTVKKSLQALMLLPILRLLNMSMPVFFSMALYSLVFIYAPMFISLHLIIKHQHITKEKLGITFRKLGRYFIVALFLGIIIAEGEYMVISADYLIPDLSPMNILGLTIVMLMFVALVEEMIFRSVLQTRLEEAFGMGSGILLTSILFGIMHSGYRNPYEILLTTIVGLILGLIFQRTKSLPLITMTHAFANIFLFGIIPHLGPGLGLFTI